MTFDTLTYARRLKRAGFPEAQAEALADANRDLLVQDLATKADLVPIQTDIAVLKGDVAMLKGDVAVLKGDMAVVKTDLATFKAEVRADFQKLDASIEALNLRLTVKLGVMMAASVALLGGILRLH